MSDMVMVLFVVYAFTLAIYVQATGTSSEVNNASIAFVDEDGSALSKELFNAFYPPRFKTPELLGADAAQAAMDRGELMFVVVIPPRFEHDLRAAGHPAIQVNIDATAMQQAGIGTGYIKNIINDRIDSFLRRTDPVFLRPSRSSWSFGSCSTRTPCRRGSRERGGDHQSDHLADRPFSPGRSDPRAGARHARAPARDAAPRVRDRKWPRCGPTASSFSWRRGASLFLIVRLALSVPFAGSVTLWLAGVVLYLFFATALGIFLGTISRSMAQFALLIVLVIVVLMLLSGGSTPVESQPPMAAVRHVSLARAPFRGLLADHHLSRGRIRRGLASLPDGRCRRSRILRLQPGTLPQVHCREQVDSLTPGSHRVEGPGANRALLRPFAERDSTPPRVPPEPSPVALRCLASASGLRSSSPFSAT